MDPITIIATLDAAVKLAMTLYGDYQAGRVILSETDAKAVHDALVKAQAATANLRPLVDAALAAAAARG